MNQYIMRTAEYQMHSQQNEINDINSDYVNFLNRTNNVFRKIDPEGSTYVHKNKKATITMAKTSTKSSIKTKDYPAVGKNSISASNTSKSKDTN